MYFNVLCTVTKFQETHLFTYKCETYEDFITDLHRANQYANGAAIYIDYPFAH